MAHPSPSASEPLALVIFDIDGVIRDVGSSYRRALADTVEQFTQGAYRPSSEAIDQLKAEGIWNNDWEGSMELIYRYFESQGGDRDRLNLDFDEIVAFFQSRYRGESAENPEQWTGYICDEPILAQRPYFESLTAANIGWGFFSGATRGSAHYILQRRIGLESPVLVAMEDAPGKPDPTGLFATLEQLQASPTCPVLYVGDTVADMYVVENAAKQDGDRPWIAVGILPPHVQTDPDSQAKHRQRLEDAGGQLVLNQVTDLTPELILEKAVGSRQ
ncbi:TIGR01548 family HAD-type hydrolase [Sodalinema gerasimenkoae]|uniref:TIGR01548 family HAD-type hydrolase n=1 Tax=Sodalinema gerasimenkoae TaxID=2862348 RepID=UPI001359B591|nr:TIGR01548 family HAD-type hydrolase [Sodalinema gerasimenkoae]